MARTPGRRPAGSGTREAITVAARRQFAELGYDRASIRSIAAEADVDPRLVGHYFGSKQELFVEVVELPFEPAEVFSRLFAVGRGGIGQRLAEFVVMALDDPARRMVLTGLVRAAASEPAAARAIRELLVDRLIGPLAAHLAPDRASLRASLVGAQVVGLTMAREVVAVPAAAAATPQELIELLAPVFELLLAEPTADRAVPERERADPGGG